MYLDIYTGSFKAYLKTTLFIAAYSRT